MKNDGVIYFHGYGSSPTTDKVQELKKHFKEVYAFPIDPNPFVSMPYLEEQIEDAYIDTFNSERELVFIGTSLGAWYAGKLAKKFFAPAVLINPRYSNVDFKSKSTIPSDILRLYEGLPFEYPAQTKFFIDPEDEVIDMNNLMTELNYTRKFLKYEPEYVTGATHRFNGEPFQKVINFIKETKF